MLIIAANTFFLKRLKDISGFKINLGKALKTSDDSINYTDDFIYNYKLNFKRIVDVYGELGKIKLYCDNLLMNNEYVIFKNDVVYEFVYELDEIKDIRKYLSSTLEKIDNAEIEANLQFQQEKVEKNNKWFSTNNKNVGKSFEVNQNLSKEDYARELAKKKNSSI